jgi:hypothetical protein
MTGRGRWNGALYFWYRNRKGAGLHFRWVSKAYSPLFSERYGHEKVLKLGRLWIKRLKP